jgi:hypothetical protein
MQILKLIYLAVLQLGRQVGSIPQSISNVTKQRRQRTVRNELEAERLDRICNPSKYRGK